MSTSYCCATLCTVKHTHTRTESVIYLMWTAYLGATHTHAMSDMSRSNCACRVDVLLTNHPLTSCFFRRPNILHVFGLDLRSCCTRCVALRAVACSRHNRSPCRLHWHGFRGHSAYLVPSKQLKERGWPLAGVVIVWSQREAATGMRLCRCRWLLPEHWDAALCRHLSGRNNATPL
jgi:hypothetical protein